MFTTYRRAVNGQVYERYYQQLENAKKQLREDAEGMGIEFNTIVKCKLDRMTMQDAMKGVKIYTKTPERDWVVFEVVVEFFSDVDYQIV